MGNTQVRTIQIYMHVLCGIEAWNIEFRMHPVSGKGMHLMDWCFGKDDKRCMVYERESTGRDCREDIKITEFP